MQATYRRSLPFLVISAKMKGKKGYSRKINHTKHLLALISKDEAKITLVPLLDRGASTKMHLNFHLQSTSTRRHLKKLSRLLIIRKWLIIMVDTKLNIEHNEMSQPRQTFIQFVNLSQEQSYRKQFCVARVEIKAARVCRQTGPKRSGPNFTGPSTKMQPYISILVKIATDCNHSGPSQKCINIGHSHIHFITLEI